MVAVAAITVALLSLMYFSPFLALHNLKQAAADRDIDALIEAVDFPAFRASLKEELGAQIAKRALGGSKEGAPFVIGTILAGPLLNSFIDQFVTPRTISSIVRRKPVESFPNELADISNGFADFIDRLSHLEKINIEHRPRVSTGYESYRQFVVRMSLPRSDESVTLVFLRSELVSWRLSGIRFSNGVWERTSKDEAASRPKQRSGTRQDGMEDEKETEAEQGTEEEFDSDSGVRWIRNPSSLISKYGERTFDVFRKHPDMIGKVQSIRPGFDPYDVSTSSPSMAVITRDGREFFLMRGCRPHVCPSYNAVIAINTKTDELFMYEHGDESQEAFFGTPDATVERLLRDYSL